MGIFSCLSAQKPSPAINSYAADKSSVAIATDPPGLIDQSTQTDDTFVQEVSHLQQAFGSHYHLFFCC